MLPSLPRSAAAVRRAQRGVSLIFALIALGVLALAAVALVRSVDTGALVIGNLGFKQDATASSDQGAEQAVAWLSANVAGALLDANQVAQGYLATASDLDATGNSSTVVGRSVVDWAGDNCASYPSGTFTGGCLSPAAGADVNGNKVQYLITRLCPLAGPANSAGNDCSTPMGASGDSKNRNECNYRHCERFLPTGSGGVYFRIIVRTVGGRNAVSFTETMVHFE
ncbi:MAG TPA: pilus assembly protein PilX [Albitalea sp.]|uniref:pilus assembly protein PilX n=1 Tax=Piscinibacter sp. TaxID=1903157 RepID=UPI002ED5BFA3